MVQAKVSGGWETLAPPQHAIRIERVIDPGGGEAAVGSVLHASHAWITQAPTTLDELERHPWADVGNAYLKDIEAAADLRAGRGGWLHPEVRQALRRARKLGESSFGWLSPTWLHPQTDRRLKSGVGPLGSFWVSCGDPESGSELSGTWVLLAGNVDEEHQLQFGDDLGLRIAIHLTQGQARIHGLTVSGLAAAKALKAVPKPCPWRAEGSWLREVKRAVGVGLGCEGRVWLTNIEQQPSRPGAWLVCGQAMRGRHNRDTATQSIQLQRNRIHDFRAEVEPGQGGSMVLTRVHREHHLGSGITVRAFLADGQSWTTDRAEPADPQSKAKGQAKPDPGRQRGTEAAAHAITRRRRPTLPATSTEWEQLRTDVDIDLEDGGLLRFVDGGPRFEVRGPSRSAGATVQVKRGAVKTKGSPPFQSDEQGSIEAHVRACELHDRMQRFGFDPDQYFRFARLPLLQRVRPQMIWAPDGELPNAEVRVSMGQPDEPAEVGERPQLLVLYGSASPMHRHKLPLPGEPGRRRAQYLSVASDPRWAWHEFGHVLNYASTGELEFPFAHSAGDALAAIALDPRSRLAEGSPLAAQRFATFPWIEVPGRNHGRCVAQGYGWCGRRNLVRLARDPEAERYHHSYFGEQLMSSSLFRLYRSLGGDTREVTDTRPDGAPAARDPAAGDLATRLSASDYCIYLVMRAIALLGPDSIAPARTAEQFVAALIEADLGTGDWNITANWPYDLEERLLSRRGGRVHKVIRWAFEQQGLYATDDPTEVVDSPGKPPAVDLFIEDARDATGGYAPVALRARGNQVQPWHAAPDVLKRNGRTLELRIRNRGAEPAPACRLRLWWCSELAGRWLGGQAFDIAQAVPGQGMLDVNIPLRLPTSPLWVLLAVDTEADPSNLKPDEGPVDAQGQALSRDALMELVAHDNNLALARLA